MKMKGKDKSLIFLFVVSLLFAFAVGAVRAVGVIRGPYLQNGAEDGVTIMWRTDQSVSSQVWYGGSPGSLDKTVTQAGTRTDHAVRITGLGPAEKYFYQVGTAQGAVLGGGDPDHYFMTSPEVASPGPVRIWAIGDSGMADNNARAVRDAYLKLADEENRPADLWLMLGDNAYDDGTDSQYQRAVFDMYPQVLRNRVLWPTRGNHERTERPYYDIFELPTNAEGGGLASGTEHYYSFDYGSVHFICLNSEETNFSKNSNSAMYQWLEDDLANTELDWIIAYWHHPPYSKGSHDSDDWSDSGGRLVSMREIALPILEAGGMDLCLTGHSHSYERSYFINGHYGYSGSFNQAGHVVQAGNGREDGGGAYENPENKGTVYIVAGSSGKTSGGGLDHAAMLVSLNRLGSVIVDVDGGRMDVRFLREYTNRTQFDDYFTIVKERLPDPDFNNDGIVNFLDLAMLIQELSE